MLLGDNFQLVVFEFSFCTVLIEPLIVFLQLTIKRDRISIEAITVNADLCRFIVYVLIELN